MLQTDSVSCNGDRGNDDKRLRLLSISLHLKAKTNLPFVYLKLGTAYAEQLIGFTNNFSMRQVSEEWSCIFSFNFPEIMIT